MTPLHLLALLLFLIFGPSAAALLLWQKLTARRWITLPSIMPADMPDGDGETL